MSETPETGSYLIWNKNEKDQFKYLQKAPRILGFNCNVCTFVYVRGQSANKDLPRVAFHALSVLMREAVGGAEARQALISPLVVGEIILHWKQRGVACEKRKRSE